MMRSRGWPVLLLVPVLLGGCASISVLTMTREKPPLDRSVVSPKLARNHYDKERVGETLGQVTRSCHLARRSRRSA